MERIENYEVNSPRWLSLENFEGEIWKDVVGFEEFYEVSNKGRVKSKERRVFIKYKKGYSSYKDIHPRIMYAHDNGHGYLWVSLNGKEAIRKYIHRLVAMAFLPNPKNKKEVDHINTNTKNNCLYNLRWASRSENALNPITRIKNVISQSEPIVVINCWGEYVGEYYGTQAAADAFGTTRANLVSVLSDKRKSITATGYTLIKKNEYDKDKDYSFIYKRGTSPFINIPTEKMVLIFKNETLVDVFPNTVIAANFYGVTFGCISNRCRYDFFKDFIFRHEKTKDREKFMYLKDANEEIRKQALTLFREKYEHLDRRKI